MTTQTAILIGLAIYAILMFSISAYWMKKVKKAADYLVGGRGLPAWALTGNIIGTCVGTGVVIGASGLAYQYGWAGSAYPVGLGVGTILAGLIYAKMRRYKFMTLGEEISSYYSGNRVVVEFSNIGLFLSQICWLTVQIMGGAAVLSVVTNLPPAICTVLAGFITAMISVPGGLKTVVYTDFFQAIILLCGFGILTKTALADSGGLAGLHTSVPKDYTSFLGVNSYGGWAVVSLILTLILGVIADPGRRLTMFSAKSEKGAKSSMFIAGTVVVAFSLIIGIIGMYTFHLNPNLSSPDQTLPWLVMNVLPPWLAALIVVSVTSAIFSSANGNAIAAGTFFVRHIYPLVTGHYAKRPLVVVRRSLAVTFVISTAIALKTGTIVGFVINFLPLTMSGLAVIILFGRFWKRRTWQGALAALITTPIVSIIVMLIPGQTDLWKNPIIPASIAGVIAFVIFSLLSSRNKCGFEEMTEKLHHERQAVEGDLRGSSSKINSENKHEKKSLINNA